MVPAVILVPCLWQSVLFNVAIAINQVAFVPVHAGCKLAHCTIYDSCVASHTSDLCQLITILSTHMATTPPQPSPYRRRTKFCWKSSSRSRTLIPRKPSSPGLHAQRSNTSQASTMIPLQVCVGLCRFCRPRCRLLLLLLLLQCFVVHSTGP